jgi:hypothetical protein
MDAQKDFACAGGLIHIATPSLRSVETATTGSGFAAQSAGSEGGNNNCGQRANATKPPTQASWLTAAVRAPTVVVSSNPA